MSWSLGVTLVEALTQHPPVWDRSTHRDPAVPESIPQPFADIAQACLRYDPVRRCTIADIKARLEPTRSLQKPTSKTQEGTRKVRVTLIAAVLVLLAVIAASSSDLIRHRHPCQLKPSRHCPRSPRSSAQSQAPGTSPQRHSSKGCRNRASSARRTPKCKQNHSGQSQGEDTGYGRSKWRSFECEG